MRISMGSDHRGLDIKKRLSELLHRLGHDVTDEGTLSDQCVDYPDIAGVVAGKVSRGEV